MKIRFTVKYLLSGYICFFALLLVCIILLPQGLLVNHGISYFGDNDNTRIFYILAFAVLGIFMLLGAWSLPGERQLRPVRWSLFLYALLLYGIAISTYTIYPRLGVWHVPFGITLFVLQFALASWLVFAVDNNKINRTLYVVQFVGGVISLLSLLHVTTYLIEGQIIYQLMFGSLLIRSLVRIGATTKGENHGSISLSK